MKKVQKFAIVLLSLFAFTLIIQPEASASFLLKESKEQWEHIESREIMGESNFVAKNGASGRKLTEKQVKELERLNMEILEKRKEVINKYVEFGILPKEEAEKIKIRMKEHFEKKKENGFIPKNGKLNGGISRKIE